MILEDRNIMVYNKKETLKMVFEIIEYQDFPIYKRECLYAITKNRKLVYIGILYNSTLKEAVNKYLHSLGLKIEDVKIWIGEFAKFNNIIKRESMILEKKCLTCFYEGENHINEECENLINNKCPLYNEII